MKRQHCGLCGLPGHDRRSHRRPVRRNLAGFKDEHGFHPFRASGDYDPIVAGELTDLRPAALRQQSRRAGTRVSQLLAAHERQTGAEQRRTEKALDAAFRSAERLQAERERQAERAIKKSEDVQARIEGLEDEIRRLPKDLTWLIRKSGSQQHEIESVPVAEWNRHFPSHRATKGMLNRAGRVVPIFGLDALASERGYDDAQDLVQDVKRARKSAQQIEDLERQLRRIDGDIAELRKNPKRVKARRLPARKARTSSPRRR